MPQVMAAVAETLAGLLLESIKTTEVSTIVTTVCHSSQNSNSPDRSSKILTHQQQPQPQQQQQQQKESPVVLQCHQRKEKEKLSHLKLTTDQIDTKKSLSNELLLVNKKIFTKIINKGNTKDNCNSERKVKLSDEQVSQEEEERQTATIHSLAAASIDEKGEEEQVEVEKSPLVKIVSSTDPSKSNCRRISVHLFDNSRESSPDDSKCIKSTLESILNLIDSAPVTTSGSVKLLHSPLTSPQSPESPASYSPKSPARSIKSPSPSPKSPSLPPASPSPSPGPYCIDLNNNLLESVEEKEEEERSDEVNSNKFPQLLPLNNNTSPPSPHPAAVSDSDSESESEESNTTIEEEPLTNPSSPNLLIDQETEPEVNCEAVTNGQEEQEEAETEETEESEVESEEDEYEVERILKKRIERRTQRTFYLVKWKGYDLNECTWEPAENLFKCQESIETFEKEERKRKRAAYRLKLNENLSKKRRFN